MLQYLKKYPLLILFAGFLFVVAIADLLVPERSFSEMENRYLKTHPQFSLKKLLKNEYTSQYEEYLNDQFVGRDGWITMKSVSESALGKIENNGILYGGEGYLFEQYPKTNDKRIQNNIGFVNTFVDAYYTQVPITISIIPNSYQILDQLLPRGVQNLDQQAYIQQIFSQISANARSFDLVPVMQQAAGQAQAYYRTDHHWTTNGAYHAYKAFVESRGRKAVELSALEELKTQVPNFYGSYYSKCKLFSAQPDTIDVYQIPCTSVTINGAQKPSLHEDEKWETRDKHAAFLWGNNGLSILRSENNLNHQQGKTSRILVVKDSYGNSFSPFLTYSYDEVWVVDLRDLGKMSEIMAQAEFDDLLILYNFMNFASDTNLPRLTY
ncbi:MAG: hypothetical protein HFG20_03485 [Anaerotruncus sp.]|nr:hypothetical protein [Anaerotruncus sp.]